MDEEVRKMDWDDMVVIFVDDSGHLDCVIGKPENYKIVVAFDIDEGKEDLAEAFVKVAKTLAPRDRDWYLLIAIVLDSHEHVINAYRFAKEVIPAWQD